LRNAPQEVVSKEKEKTRALVKKIEKLNLHFHRIKDLMADPKNWKPFGNKALKIINFGKCGAL